MPFAIFEQPQKASPAVAINPERVTKILPEADGKFASIHTGEMHAVVVKATVHEVAAQLSEVEQASG